MDAQQVALRRAIALIERLLPYVIWEAIDDDAEAHAEITLVLLREALTK